MLEAERDELLSDLRRKLEKRRDEPGFAANVRDLETRIAELEALTFEPAWPEPGNDSEGGPSGEETLSGGA